MTKSITLVTDVVVKEMPFDGTNIRVASLARSAAEALPGDELRTVPEVEHYNAKVHEFRGGPYGREGIKVAFGPRVEEALRLPLKAMDEQLDHYAHQVVRLEDNNDCLSSRLLSYNTATFWQRLKWAFTGVIL